MSDVEIIYLSAGVGITLFLVLIMALMNTYSRVRILRMINKQYGVSEIDLDSTNYSVAIVKTTDIARMMNGKGYRIEPEAFKLIDGIPVIRHHWSSTEPVFLRGYSAIQYVNNFPTSITGKATVEVDQWYQGAKKPIKETVEVDLKNAKEINVLDWRQELGQIKKFEPIATPDEFGAFLILKDAEAEAKAILLKMQALEQMKIFLIIAMILSGLALGASYFVYDKEGQIIEKLNMHEGYLIQITNYLANSTYTPVSQNNTLPKAIPVPSG
jgi:hypothetical protein